MDKVITVSEAAIQTATVEIKTIQVNKKQMTLAVFRQLPREDYLDYWEVAPTGNAWGTVNYHLPECKEMEGHQHVVFERNGILQHDIVPFYYSCVDAGDTARDHEKTLKLLTLLHRLALIIQRKSRLLDPGVRGFRTKVSGYEVEVRLGDYMAWCGGMNYRQSTLLTKEEQEKQAVSVCADNFKTLASAYKLDISLEGTEALVKQMEEKVDQVLEYQRLDTELREKYRKYYEAIVALPQLFIAV